MLEYIPIATNLAHGTNRGCYRARVVLRILCCPNYARCTLYRGPVKNKNILLSDGSWLAPASLEGPKPGVGCEFSVLTMFLTISTVTGFNSSVPCNHANKNVLQSSNLCADVRYGQSVRKLHVDLPIRSLCHHLSHDA